MSKPAATEDDDVVGIDIHVVMIPSPGGPVPTPMPMPFKGKLNGELSGDVFIENCAAATVDSTADNLPQHVPTGGPFQKEPANRGVVVAGSESVFVNDKKFARAGDRVKTCGDPTDQDHAVIVGVHSVFIG